MKGWREWSDDRLWITWGVVMTLGVCLLCWMWAP